MTKFTDTLLQIAKPYLQKIMAHPFVTGLTDGSLPQESFRYYIIQDAMYLRDFARGLSLLASKATDTKYIVMFCKDAVNGILVEESLHEEYMSKWGMTKEDVNRIPMSPNCLMYTSYFMRIAYERSFEEGVSVFLPCYWIYLLVGKELIKVGSPNPDYQKWIDTYGSSEFEAIVQKILDLVDALAAQTSPSIRSAMLEHFIMGARFEYLFWDMGYRQQKFSDWGL